MNMRNILFSLLCVLVIAASGVSSSAASTPGSWRLHPSFDNDPERIIATPFGAYFFGLAQPWRPNFPDNAERQGFLYRYLLP